MTTNNLKQKTKTSIPPPKAKIVEFEKTRYVVYDDGNIEYYDAKKHSILENKKRYYLKRRMLRQLAQVKHLFTK